MKRFAFDNIPKLVSNVKDAIQPITIVQISISLS